MIPNSYLYIYTSLYTLFIYYLHIIYTLHYLDIIIYYSRKKQKPSLPKIFRLLPLSIHYIYMQYIHNTYIYILYILYIYVYIYIYIYIVKKTHILYLKWQIFLFFSEALSLWNKFDNSDNSASFSIWREFSGRGFKLLSDQLSVGTSKNSSEVNTIWICSFCINSCDCLRPEFNFFKLRKCV